MKSSLVKIGEGSPIILPCLRLERFIELIIIEVRWKSLQGVIVRNKLSCCLGRFTQTVLKNGFKELRRTPDRLAEACCILFLKVQQEVKKLITLDLMNS